MTFSTIDTLLSTPETTLPPWEFDDAVAAAFANMAQRSIPGYTLLLQLIHLATQRFAQPNSRLYDLGCSLGAVTRTFQHALTVPDCHIIAVDNAEAMISRCQTQLSNHPCAIPTELCHADVRDITIDNASVVALNFTLQFIPPADRQTLLTRIYQGLRPGGVLILSEKLTFTPFTIDERLVSLYHDFKQLHGYTPLQIAQKQQRLAPIMHLDTLATHQARLSQAGFTESHLWFQALNFGSLLAIKGESPCR